MYAPSQRVWFELHGEMRHGTIIAHARDPKGYKIRVDGTGDVVEAYAARIKGAFGRIFSKVGGYGHLNGGQD